MKKIFFQVWASLFMLSVLVSCGKKQQVSDRVSVWDDDSAELVSLSANKVIVPFHRTSGNLAQVQVSMNGVIFNMWWDTGASITCISALELQQLEKEGKIQLEDYQGRLLSRIADGSSTESFVFNIKEILIQGRDNQYLVIHDVDAAVTPNNDAPLLIGQNIIQRLPPHIFREDEGVIEFERQQ